MGAIDEVERAVGEVARAVGPTVVRIGRGPGRGSGVVVSSGAVLTNAHNLRGDAVTVTFAGGRTETGTVAGVDVDGDLAVVRVDTADSSAPEWRGDGVELGTAVFALTRPPGSHLRITVGTVSAVGRAFRGPRGRLIGGGIEHTAPLARGSSGSPVVDIGGRLLGINTHRLGEGFYLAVPASAALRDRVDALGRGESPRRRYLGVALLPSHASRRMRSAVGLPEREGLLVRAVDGDGPAARAGVQPGDLLVEAAGSHLATSDELFEALDRLGEEQPLHLRVLRGVDELELVVVFDEPLAAPGPA